MKARVLKYAVPIQMDEIHLTLRKDAKVLSVHLQLGAPQLWVLINKDVAEELTQERSFIWLPTGVTLQVNDGHELVFIGTVLVMAGNEVYHLFEIT